MHARPRWPGRCRSADGPPAAAVCRSASWLWLQPAHLVPSRYRLDQRFARREMSAGALEPSVRLFEKREETGRAQIREYVRWEKCVDATLLQVCRPASFSPCRCQHELDLEAPAGRTQMARWQLQCHARDPMHRYSPGAPVRPRLGSAAAADGTMTN
eukprot:360737-Chlamydomonas_euryale.AAC.3